MSYNINRRYKLYDGRPQKIKDGVRVTLILPGEVVAKIDELAEKSGASRSGVLRMQIKNIFQATGDLK